MTEENKGVDENKEEVGGWHLADESVRERVGEGAGGEGSGEGGIPGQSGSQPEDLAQPQRSFESSELFFLSLGPRVEQRARPMEGPGNIC